MTKDLVYSKCGIYCNFCPAYKDNSRTEEDRQKGSAIWERYFGLHFSPKIVKCEGCQAPEPWKTGNLLPARSCVVRACAVHNGVKTCAHCSIFPCEEYSKEVPGAELRRQREDAANIKISDDEYRAYIEPYEGQPHLRDLHATLQSEDMVSPRPFSAGEHITPFPKKTNLTPDKQEVMSQLHSLLGAIFTQQAKNYAGQILMDRKRPYLWGVTWVMGLHGEIKDGKLVLDSTICGERKECSRLVRKSDNTLHDAVQDAVDTLSDYGFQAEFEPAKKSWTLTLGIDESSGGSAILESLKSYISCLVQKYGEPTYNGSYNLKGKAFKLFTKLDMSDL